MPTTTSEAFEDDDAAKSSATGRARSKSHTATRPDTSRSSTRTFSGLRSRWTSFAARWMWSRASAICAAYRLARDSGRRRSGASSSTRERSRSVAARRVRTRCATSSRRKTSTRAVRRRARGLSEAVEATRRRASISAARRSAGLGGRGPADDSAPAERTSRGDGERRTAFTASGRGDGAASSRRRHARTLREEDATREDARVRREAGRRAGTRREHTSRADEDARRTTTHLPKPPTPMTSPISYASPEHVANPDASVRAASADDRPIARERHCGDAETRGGPS